MRSPPPEDEGAAETTCDELTITPIFVPLHHSVGRRQKIGSKVKPGKKGGVGGVKIWFYFLIILL